MSFFSRFSRKTRRASKFNTPHPRCYLHLETLEDRALLSGAGWLLTSSVTNSGRVWDLAQDAVGNTYATGYFKGTMTIGSTILTSDGTNEDLYVAKMTPEGALVWANRFGGAAGDFGYGIDVGSDGSIYVTGKFGGTMSIATESGSITLTSAGAQDVFVLKLDTGGDVLWARRWGTAAGNDSSASIAVAEDGSIYVNGAFNRESQIPATADFGLDPNLNPITMSASDGDNFLVKMNSDGDSLWARQLDWGVTPWDVMTEAGGDVFIVGGNVARYDSNGNLLWSQERVENVGALYQDPATGHDYLYIAEVYGPPSITDDSNHVLRKLDGSNGNVIWEKPNLPSGGGVILAIATDASGNVYVTGDYSESSVDFDPGVGTFFLSSGGRHLQKLDANGDFVSARRMGYDFALDVMIDAAGNAFLGGAWGWGGGTADFDLGDSTVVQTSQFVSNYQGFILKMTQGLGAISGRVFADADDNGTQGMEEPAMAGRTVYVDQNSNSSLDPGEVSATTDAYGVYNLIHLPAGTHTVRQVPPVGWSTSTPGNGAHIVTLAADQFVGGRDFGAYGAPSTTTYTKNTSLSIRDLTTATSTIVVSGGTSFIYDVDVSINITHTNDADLDVYLIAPDGTGVELTTDNGGSGDHYTNTIFDDEATLAITAGGAPFSDRYRPEGMLNALDGKNANGTWKLTVYDDTRKNTGTLVSWSLTVKGAAAPPLPTLSINSVSKAEGNSGTTAFTFTVTLSAASSETVTVNYATVNGTASATDYTSQSGTLTFAPGQTSKTITILVKGDNQKESNETFSVKLADALFADILNSQGLGTILNDD